MFLEEKADNATTTTPVNDRESNVCDNTYDKSSETNNTKHGNDPIEDIGVSISRESTEIFWKEIIYQWLNQLHVSTTENELRDTVVEEIMNNKDFYNCKFEIAESALLEFCDKIDSTFTNCQLYLSLYVAFLIAR